MQEIFVVADNVFSPLGKSTLKNFEHLRRGVSGIEKHHNQKLSDAPFYASLFRNDELALKTDQQPYTRFENMLIASVTGALSEADIDPRNQHTVLIISSTKGNIGLLDNGQSTLAVCDKVSIPNSAKRVGAHFGFKTQPVIVSNACISGIVALITGMRLLKSGHFKNAVITGADEVSKFILSGFQAFHAVSNEPCKPFDADRTGITLGEGAGTIILSSQERFKGNISIKGGSVSNDANHISAPSRTGAELSCAINNTLKEADTDPTSIDLISAHGTATLYNDEMEAKALALSGLQEVPLNSLKGYYGHTLGAAGLIESIISIQSMREGVIIPTKGFHASGVSHPLNIFKEVKNTTVNTCLKTASGFGGCNAAVLFSKN